MIEAKIVADSLNEFGNRITTMMVTFPRFILAELNTHRMFSRNSASSRAIPFKKMVESVKKNPFIPIAWQKDHSGMQGSEYITDEYEINRCISTHLTARDVAIVYAEEQYNNRVTKQLCNRLLEPFMWHTVLITATEWENFFALRCPQYEVAGTLYRSRKDVHRQYDPKISGIAKYDDSNWLTLNKGQAEIHMMALAEAMWDARFESVPVQLKAGEWHIPFNNNPELEDWYNNSKRPEAPYWSELDYDERANYEVKVATAMCARVSYTVVGEESKEPNYENDIKLHDRLLVSKHLSPFEHCAKAMQPNEFWIGPDNANTGWSGNFRGFIQYRKMFNNENITTNE